MRTRSPPGAALFNLRYGKGGDRGGFLVLSERPGGTPGEAINLDQVGISHFSWWVDDLRALHDKLKAAGVKILVPPSEVRRALAKPPRTSI
jgi:catechol 2,3-dioxygenase-like lactoylglutathione lyase family enzyme